MPSAFALFELPVAFLAMALGSNFPAYGAGEASPLVIAGVATVGDIGEAIDGDAAALLSIWSRRVLPPVASDSFCFCASAAACFAFHASSLASLSAFSSLLRTAYLALPVLVTALSACSSIDRGREDLPPQLSR